MAFCSNCGMQSSADACFCNECGTSIVAAVEQKLLPNNTNNMSRFNVVIEGRCLDGFDQNKVLTDLAKLTRQSESTATRFLNGQSITVKSGIDSASAERYLSALRTIGVACRIKEERSVALSVEPTITKEKNIGMVFCRGCSKEIHETAPTCPHCGALQGEGVIRNEISVTPDGIKGWSWGAFFLNWIWAIENRTWIGLLALIPGIGFIMAIILGIKGREWAWKNKKWENIEHFNRVQKKWSFWGVFIVISVFVIGTLAAIAIPVYRDYQTKAKTNEGILTLTTCKLLQSEEFATNGAFASGNIYQICDVSSLPKGVKGLGMATGSSAIEMTVFFDGNLLDGKALSLFGTATSSGEVAWECVSGSIQKSLLPSSCNFDQNWKLNTLPFQSFDKYKDNPVATITQPKAKRTNLPD
jgi:Tfp pilus assembly major pilin PilA